MTKNEVIEHLRSTNPRASLAEMTMYADAYIDYRTAQTNVDEHGPIVLHPRTGAPIENPYLVIRDRARVALGKSRLRADSLWISA